MIARTARDLADEAARAEALLNAWPPSALAVGTAQAVLAHLRISLRIEAQTLAVEELQQFGETL